MLEFIGDIIAQLGFMLCSFYVFKKLFATL